MYKELKELLKHSLIYGIGIYIGKAVGFLMIPVYTRYLTPGDYGVLSLLNYTTYIAGILIVMGITQAVFKFYFEYKNEVDRKQVISTALLFIILSALIFTLILIKLSPQISALVFGNASYSYFFALIFIANFFDNAAVVPFAFIRAEKRSLLFSVISLLRLILALSLNIYLIVFLDMKVLGVLWSSVISASVSFIILFGYTLRGVRLFFSFAKLKEMLIYSIPLVPAGLFSFIIHFSDRYFLNYFSVLDEVGIYSLGYKLSIMLLFVIGQPFSLIWSAYMFEVAGKENAKEFYSRIFTYFSLVCIIFALGLSIFIKDILKILVDPSFFEAYKVVPVVLCGFVLLSMSNIFDVGIFLKKKTIYKTFNQGIAVMVCLALNFLLIPRYGMMGAAWATFFSYFALSLATYITSNRIYYIRYEWGRLVNMAAVALLIYFGSALVEIQNFFAAIVLKSALFLTFPFLLFIFGFFREEELKKMKEILQKMPSRIKAINHRVLNSGKS